MQAWAAKPRKYKSATESTLEGLKSVGYKEETFYGSPVGVLAALDQGWGQILDKLNDDDQTAAADRGHNSAEFAEAIRGIATHSPDKAYNKRASRRLWIAPRTSATTSTSWISTRPIRRHAACTKRGQPSSRR
jgi:hypothetical protein